MRICLPLVAALLTPAVMLPTLALSEPPAAEAPDAGVTARVPPYEAPAAHLDALGVPSGPAPTQQADGAICYAPASHQRLATLLAAIEPLSDSRARLAWTWGYIDGREAGGAETRAERAKRIDAEARAAAAEAQGERLWWIAGTAAALGIAGGVVVGVVAK